MYTSGLNSRKYGLISRTGVPSKISRLEIIKRFSRISFRWTTENPIGLGRLGDRVANKLLDIVSPDGTTFKLYSEILWKWHIIVSEFFIAVK